MPTAPVLRPRGCSCTKSATASQANPEDWTREEVAQWLAFMSFERYAEPFRPIAVGVWLHVWLLRRAAAPPWHKGPWQCLPQGLWVSCGCRRAAAWQNCLSDT